MFKNFNGFHLVDALHGMHVARGAHPDRVFKKTVETIVVVCVTLLLWNLPSDSFGIDGLNIVQQRIIAIFAFATLMWIMEIVPSWATSVAIMTLMLLFCSDSGVKWLCDPDKVGALLSYKGVMACFADPVIMLFIGGFILAIAATKTGLDAQLAKVLLKPFGTRILPAWRSDKASKVENLKAWNDWMDRLSKAAKMPVKTWDDFLEAMAKRHAFFAKCGCVISDYGVTEIFAEPYTEAEVRRIFKKARGGKALAPEEALKLKSAWLYEGLAADAKAGWAAQLHYCCLRDTNTKMFKLLGPDTGFDCIGEWNVAASLARLFDRLEQNGALPRTILYTLNPKDTEMLATLMGSFQHGPERGRMQLGAAWWFLDQKDGMRKQLEALGALGCLGNFVGMLTDSRSFLSYTRHEYFRRILCQMLGKEIEAGELPHDIPWIGGLVSDICYNNAERYFFG